MKARLAILVVVLASLAVAFAVKSGRPSASVALGEAEAPVFDGGRYTTEEIRDMQKRLAERLLPGKEPPEKPDLHVRVYPDPGQKGKRQLRLEISESHGYYVEGFNILIWHKVDANTLPEKSRLRLPAVIDKYVPANGTLVDCTQIVPIEMSHIDNDLGTELNWEAEVLSHGRAREKNPDSLPRLADSYSCD